MTSQSKPAATPLSHVRVVNIGTGWASRVAAMLLADQGADVIEVVRPARTAHPADPLLDRGKRLFEADLKDAAARDRVRKLLSECDIALENMRGGAAAALGLDYASLDDHQRLIYVSLPGFASGDENHAMPAWEGVIDAALGVYTDISPLGPLIGGTPVYSVIPMASAYGGVLGALTASMGLVHRQRSGRGQCFEVPLADAVMSAMALLIARIEGQPQRYNYPAIDHTMMHTVFPILRELREHLSEEHIASIIDFLKGRAMPGLNFYHCADQTILFVCAIDHVYQTRAFLETVGVFDRLIAEGMVAENPYSESTDGNNLNNAGELTPYWRARVLRLISESISKRTGKQWETLLRNANVPATVVQTDSEWLADKNLLAGGVITDLDDAQLGMVRMPGRFLSIDGAAVHSPALSPRQTAPDADWQHPAIAIEAAGPSSGLRPQDGLLKGVRVLDLSNIIAGPAAGRTLAEHGAEVVRIDSPAPQAGPRTTMWFGIDVNQGKRAIVLDLKTGEGRDALASLVRQSDVVLHNFLDSSARSIGISHEQLTAIKPDIISCQISAWGGSEGGPYKDDPAFDPVLQAATGIMTRYGTPEKPVMHGIASCVDYLTGFSASLGIAQALFAKQRGCGGSHVRTSLAMGAQLVQFAFMTRHAKSQQQITSGQSARGDGCEQHLYQLNDCWAFVGCRPGEGEKLAGLVGASEVTAEAIGARLCTMSLAQLRQLLANLPGAGAIAVRSLAQLRDQHTLDHAISDREGMPRHSLRLRRGPHPSGYPTTIPMATWIRPAASALSSMAPAPWPGQHTVELLREAGYDEKQIAALLDSGAAQSGWTVLRHYLPY